MSVAAQGSGAASTIQELQGQIATAVSAAGGLLFAMAARSSPPGWPSSSRHGPARGQRTSAGCCWTMGWYWRPWLALGYSCWSSQAR